MPQPALSNAIIHDVSIFQAQRTMRARLKAARGVTPTIFIDRQNYCGTGGYPSNLSMPPHDALLCALIAVERRPAVTPLQPPRGAATGAPLKKRIKSRGTALSSSQEDAALQGATFQGENVLAEAEDAVEKKAWVLVLPLEHDVVTEVTPEK